MGWMDVAWMQVGQQAVSGAASSPQTSGGYLRIQPRADVLDAFHGGGASYRTELRGRAKEDGGEPAGET